MCIHEYNYVIISAVKFRQIHINIVLTTVIEYSVSC